MRSERPPIPYLSNKTLSAYTTRMLKTHLELAILSTG
jgi:hypothetical protein